MVEWKALLDRAETAEYERDEIIEAIQAHLPEGFEGETHGAGVWAESAIAEITAKLRERCARLERERDGALRLAKRLEVDRDVARSQRDGIDVALRHANDAYAKTAHEKHDALDRCASLEEALRRGVGILDGEGYEGEYSWHAALGEWCAATRALLGPSPEGSPPTRSWRAPAAEALRSRVEILEAALRASLNWLDIPARGEPIHRRNDLPDCVAKLRALLTKGENDDE